MEDNYKRLFTFASEIFWLPLTTCRANKILLEASCGDPVTVQADVQNSGHVKRIWSNFSDTVRYHGWQAAIHS